MWSSRRFSASLQAHGIPLILCLSHSRATIQVYFQNDTAVQLARKFTDLPAAEGFGPRIPGQGFRGRLQLATPDFYACSGLDHAITELSSAGNETGDSGIPRSLRGSHGGHGSYGSQWSHGSHKARSGDRDGRNTGHVGGLVSHGSGTGKDKSNETDEDVADSSDSTAVAVLVSRSLQHDGNRCTFKKKVLNAQAAGYELVVVYDYKQETLFKMGTSADHSEDHPAIGIPLVLVTHESGMALRELIDECDDPRGPEVFVDNQDPFMKMFVAVNFTMLMIICGFFLALVTCGTMMVVTVHRYLRRYEELVGNSMRLMALPEVLELPEVVVDEMSKLLGDPCPICLETYQTGDKLRGLPCGHAFHGACITPWLTEGQRNCPICKKRVEVKRAPTPPASVASLGSRHPPPGSSDSREARAAAQPPVLPASSPLLGHRWEESARVGSSSVVSTLTSPILAAVASRTGQRGPGEVSQGGRGEQDTGTEGDRLPLLLNSRGPSSNGGSIREASRV